MKKQYFYHRFSLTQKPPFFSLIPMINITTMNCVFHLYSIYQTSNHVKYRKPQHIYHRFHFILGIPKNHIFALTIPKIATVIYYVHPIFDSRFTDNIGYGVHLYVSLFTRPTAKGMATHTQTPCCDSFSSHSEIRSFFGIHLHHHCRLQTKRPVAEFSFLLDPRADSNVDATT